MIDLLRDKTSRWLVWSWKLRDVRATWQGQKPSHNVGQYAVAAVRRETLDAVAACAWSVWHFGCLKIAFVDCVVFQLETTARFFAMYVQQ